MFSPFKIILVLSCLLNFAAFAKSTYVLDKEQFSSEANYLNCKEVVKASIEAEADNTIDLFNQVFDHLSNESTKVQLIQNDKGIALKGERIYEGLYSDKIYLVKHDGFDIYPLGLYLTIQVIFYENGIEIHKNPLNHQTINEAKNRPSCRNIFYKKVEL